MQFLESMEKFSNVSSSDLDGGDARDSAAVWEEEWRVGGRSKRKRRKAGDKSEGGNDAILNEISETVADTARLMCTRHCNSCNEALATTLWVTKCGHVLCSSCIPTMELQGR